MLRRILFLTLCLISAFAQAEVTTDSIKAQADSAYTHEQYDQAIALYSQLAEQGESAVIYYNLGCAYYRKGDIAHSILWHERAALLDPGNADIAYNLQLLRDKTIDRIEPIHEFFLFQLWHDVVNLMSTDTWAIMALVCFGLALATLAWFLFSSRMSVRRMGLYTCIIFFLLTVLGNVCAYQQHEKVKNRTSGVIVASSVTVKSTPSDSGNDLFVIHEGTRLDVQDDSMKEWAEIRISDGKVGWVPKKSFERI
ncbi:MAG: SH3 domain-containing protein [Bacteroidaceae bacterium]